MSPCPHCGLHVRSRDTTCVHCGARVGSQSLLHSSAAAALLGLAVACTGDKTSDSAHTGSTSTQPLYGVTYTDTDTDSDTDSDSDSDSDSDTATDVHTGRTTHTGTTGHTGHTGAAADTGTTIQPLYGVTTTY
jgi:hypothetical protein